MWVDSFQWNRWIFLAVQHTRKTLKNDRQTLKLSMYDKLIKILTYVTMGWFFFVVVLMMKQYGLVPWPWRYAWVWQAFGQCGYFIVLCSVGWTWGECYNNSNLKKSNLICLCLFGGGLDPVDMLTFHFFSYCLCVLRWEQVPPT